MIYIAVAIAALSPVAGLAMLSLLSRRSPDLGVRDGKLSACPATRNCVCTQCNDPLHQCEPIAYHGQHEQALQQLKRLLVGMPEARITVDTGNYVRAELTSRVFRFVDDVELLVDPQQQVIHFRSASRIGRSDLGANRRRMEQIRKRFAEFQQAANQPAAR